MDGLEPGFLLLFVSPVIRHQIWMRTYLQRGPVTSCQFMFPLSIIYLQVPQAHLNGDWSQCIYICLFHKSLFLLFEESGPLPRQTIIDSSLSGGAKPSWSTVQTFNSYSHYEVISVVKLVHVSQLLKSQVSHLVFGRPQGNQLNLVLMLFYIQSF